MQSRNKAFKLNFKLSNKAFTLIELIVVIVIIAILSSVVILEYTNIKNNSKKEICDYNRKVLKREYQAYLIINNISHSEIVFSEFILNSEKVLCPENGIISYENSKIQCSKHFYNIPIEDDNSQILDSVPYLSVNSCKEISSFVN